MGGISSDKCNLVIQNIIKKNYFAIKFNVLQPEILLIVVITCGSDKSGWQELVIVWAWCTQGTWINWYLNFTSLTLRARYRLWLTTRYEYWLWVVSLKLSILKDLSATHLKKFHLRFNKNFSIGKNVNIRNLMIPSYL